MFKINFIIFYVHTCVCIYLYVHVFIYLLTENFQGEQTIDGLMRM